ncbi:hypothetical protein ATY81_04840 [Rhizobium sp. R72]|uniref:DUF1254 domain-containing protein n=1 Tax=unclassified Rhizobium TaxID=2613769 RepID=UPI000B538540|nr:MULTISPECIES: DUF1254 domain-containing protein [unclassified Rhizobium]OWV96718.1 hypothetical protein ATY79_24945 [Rhizobium sp. R693]OWW05273.1 hypothetical protein ATY81_04840 [Rhizobium sp. R72]OWW06330.1 hypothetical protein ATY80_04840 [Rhizobium sp. R711]
MRFIALLCTLLLAGPALSADKAMRQTFDQEIERKAVQAVVWGIPAVNYDLMRQEMLAKTPGKVGQVIYWGRPLDWRNQTLTPNPDALYFMVFFSTKDGPVVLDLPPAGEKASFNGNIVTAWQLPLEDAGLLGYDKGKGGKFVVLPPGYKEKLPDGFIPLQSEVYGGYMLFRSNLASHDDADVQASIDYGRKLRVYPLSTAGNPSETVFSDVKDTVFDSTIRWDESFFDNLNRVIQEEPWIARDRVMIDQLKSLGIEKGKPFEPDQHTKSLLTKGIKEAETLLEAKYDAGLPPFFTEKSRWTFPAYPDLITAAQSNFDAPDAYPVDHRGVAYSYAYIGIKRLGAGQFYSISIRDKNGDAFDGSGTYHLNIPADVPVQQYWSVTAYDRQTHALIKNVARASRSSQIPDLVKNSDGSVDLYFGPKAPKGKDANWVPTDPKRSFELMFRAYGPTKEFFDKKWILPDVVKITTR